MEQPLHSLRGGNVIQSYIPIIFFVLAAGLLLALSLGTEFNLTGYHYTYEETSEKLIVEDGFFMPDSHQIPASEENIAELAGLMQSIDQAETFFFVNVVLLLVFAFVFTGFRWIPAFRSGRMRKYIWLYMVLFVFIILWSVTTHIDMHAQISRQLQNLL